MLGYYPAIQLDISYSFFRFTSKKYKEDLMQQERRDNYNQKFEDLLLSAKVHGQDEIK